MEEKLHTPEGVRDIYSRECEIKLTLQKKLNQVLHLYGYEDIQTPTFEYYDVFREEIGSTSTQELYKFFDRDGNILSLRPDITPYKTVFLSKSRGCVDAESQILIEQAIAYAERLYEIREIPIYQRWDDKAKNDFQLIDLSITERALEIAGA